MDDKVLHRINKIETSNFSYEITSNDRNANFEVCSVKCKLPQFDNIDEFMKYVDEFIKEHPIFRLWQNDWDGACYCSEGNIIIDGELYIIKTLCRKSSSYQGYNQLIVEGGKYKKEISDYILTKLNQTTSGYDFIETMD